MSRIAKTLKEELDALKTTTMNRMQILELLCVHSDNETIECHTITQVSRNRVVVLYDVLPFPEPTPELAPSPRRMVAVVELISRSVISETMVSCNVEYTPVNFP